MHPVEPSQFPASTPAGADEATDFDDEALSVSELRTAPHFVALLLEDLPLRDHVAAVMLGAGLVSAGEDVLPAAVVAITDAKGDAAASVGRLRAKARSDAVIVVLLDPEAPASDAHAAYDAGAFLCVRQPIDDAQLAATVRSALDLHSARAHADDLMRQLDVQSHLAALGRVTANFTHELSNPLAAVMSSFESIKEAAVALARLRDVLVPALRNGLSAEAAAAAKPWLSAAATTENVLDAVSDTESALGRINAVLSVVKSLARGHTKACIEDVDLAAIVREVRQWAEKDLRGIEVQELIEGAVIARADRRLVGQIVLNLVTNAAQAARQLPSPRVRLHAYGSGDRAIVSVRDNGPGVPSPIRDHIFEPFFTTRRGQGGTGLGLTLVREYAGQTRGHITLWTAPGRGACFRLHLPRSGT